MTQTLTFTVPRTLLLNANQRLHQHRKARMASDLRITAHLYAKAEKLQPVNGYVHVLFTFTYPNKSRIRDALNLADTVKPCVDGLTDYGLWVDDSIDHIEGPDVRIDPLPDKTLGDQVRVTITITDRAAA